MQDPIVEEVRAVRKALMEKYRTPEAYYRHLLRVQKKFKNRVVSRKPQPALRATGQEVREPAARYGRKAKPRRSSAS